MPTSLRAGDLEHKRMEIEAEARAQGLTGAKAAAGHQSRGGRLRCATRSISFCWCRKPKI